MIRTEKKINLMNNIEEFLFNQNRSTRYNSIKKNTELSQGLFLTQNTHNLKNRIKDIEKRV